MINLSGKLINLSIAFSSFSLYNLVITARRVSAMTENEKELIQIIRGSSDPQKVAEYMLNLFLDYLRTNAPSEEKAAVSPRESA